MNKLFLYNIILLMYCFLFYSPRCESSANFIRIITSEKIDNMFNQISINYNPIDDLSLMLNQISIS